MSLSFYVQGAEKEQIPMSFSLKLVFNCSQKPSEDFFSWIVKILSKVLVTDVKFILSSRKKKKNFNKVDFFLPHLMNHSRFDVNLPW